MGATSRILMAGERASTRWATPALVLLPIGLMAVWHQSDRRLPSGDAAGYAAESWALHETFEQQGPAAGLRDLYFRRGWRPILFPALAVPSLAAFGGDVEKALAATLTGIYALLLGYSYLWLRLRLDSLAAGVGACCLATLPWVLGAAMAFMAEQAALCCLIAAGYHLERSGAWRSRLHSLASGAALALAFCLRPVESLPAGALIAVVSIGWGRRQSTITAADVAWAALLTAGVTTLLCARILLVLRSVPLSLLLLLGALILSLAAAARFRLNLRFAGWVVLTLTITALWYLPAARETAGWIYQTSFGEMGQLYPGPARSLGQSAAAVLTEYSAIPATALAALFLTALAARRRSGGDAPPMAALCIGLALVASMFIANAVAGVSDPRRLSIGIYFLCAGLISGAVAPSVCGTGRRLLLVGGIAALQVASLATAAAGHAAPWPLTAPAASRLPDPNWDVLRAAQQFCRAGTLIAPLSIAPAEACLFDAHTLAAMARIQRLPLRFNHPWNFRALEEGYRQLSADRYDYILLNLHPSDSTFNPDSQLTADLIRRSRGGSLHEVGWDLERAFSVNGQPIYLLRRLNP